MRSLPTTILAAAALALGGATAAATGAGQTPDATLPGTCSDQQVAPTSVVILCGDAGLVAQDLVWQDWGAARAPASGTALVNTCNPDCAAGNRVEHPITLTATRLVDCTYGRPQYTRLAYSYQQDSGAAQEDTVPFPCPPRPHADPQIRRMRVSVASDAVLLQLSVCAVRGNLLVVINETTRAGGRTRHAHKRTRELSQTARCQRHTLRWTLRPELRGPGDYRVAATVSDDDGQRSKTVSRTIGSPR